MKELSNAAPFRWVNLPPPSYSEGMEFYHQSSRRNYRMRQPPSGPADSLLMRIADICLAFPGLVLALAAGAVLLNAALEALTAAVSLMELLAETAGLMALPPAF